MFSIGLASVKRKKLYFENRERVWLKESENERERGEGERKG